MKITIKNKKALIFNEILHSIPLAIIPLILSFVVAVIYLQLSLMKDEIYGQAFLISLIPALVLLLIKTYNAYLYAQGTSLEVDSKQVSFTVSGFKKGQASFLNSEIQNMVVTQTLLDKILGLSSIVITQISSKMVIFGVDFDEATKFVNDFNSKHLSTT